MSGLKPYRCGGRARLRASATILNLAAFALVAPMLVLCEDGERHAAVELVIALCCSPAQADTGEAARPPENAGSGDNGCSGSCTDTPLLTSVVATSSDTVVRTAVTAAGAPTVVLVSPLMPGFSGRETALSGSLSPPHFRRSTVLRI